MAKLSIEESANAIFGNNNQVKGQPSSSAKKLSIEESAQAISDNPVPDSVIHAELTKQYEAKQTKDIIQTNAPDIHAIAVASAQGKTVSPQFNSPEKMQTGDNTVGDKPMQRQGDAFTRFVGAGASGALQAIQGVKQGAETAVESFQKGNPGEGIVDIGTTLLHGAMTPFTVPFGAASSAIGSTGETGKQVEQGISNVMNLPFDAIKQGSELTNKALSAIGIDTKSLFVFGPEVDAKLNSLVTEIAGIAALAKAHQGAKGIVDKTAGKEIQQVTNIGTSIPVEPNIPVEPKPDFTTPNVEPTQPGNVVPADPRSRFIVNSIENKVKEQIAKGEPIDEKIITSQIENVVSKPESDRLGKLYTDALEHNKSLKAKPSVIEPEKPVESTPLPNTPQRSGKSEEIITTAPRHELPPIISDKIESSAQNMKAELEGASQQKDNSYFQTVNEGQGWETKGRRGGVTTSTFPEWFNELGRSKQDVLGAIDKIIKDNGADKGKLVEDVKSLILSHLTEGRTQRVEKTNSGKTSYETVNELSADAELTSFLDKYRGKEITLDELNNAYKEVSTGYESKLKEDRLKQIDSEIAAKNDEIKFQNEQDVFGGDEVTINKLKSEIDILNTEKQDLLKPKVDTPIQSVEGVRKPEEVPVPPSSAKVEPVRTPEPAKNNTTNTNDTRVPKKPVFPDYGTPGNDRVVAEQVKKLVERTSTEIPDMPTREVANLKAHAEAVTDIINSDPARAKRIAMGEEDAPQGIMPRFFSIAVENDALRRGDTKTIIELAKSPLNKLVTAAGQTLRAEQEFGTNSPVKAIADVIAARKDAQKKKFGEKLGAIIDNRVVKLESELKATQEKLAAAEANKGVEKLKSQSDFEKRKANRQATKQELDTEFEGLYSQLVRASSTLNAGINPEALPILMKMAKNRVSLGINTVEGLVDSLYEKLKEAGYSKRDIRDAISGYGRETKQRPRSEVEKDLAELKKQAKIISAIEDLESGKTVAKKIPGKGTPNEKTEQLRKVYQKMLPKVDVSDAQKLKTQKTKLTNEIEKLQEQLAQEDYFAKERKPLVPDAELEQLREKVKQLKAGIQKSGTDITFDEAAKISELSKVVGEAKDGMAGKRRELGSSEPTPAEKAYGDSMYDYLTYVEGLKKGAFKVSLQDFKDMPFKSKAEIGQRIVRRGLSHIPGIAKSIAGSYDDSAPFRHGAFMIPYQPKLWAKNAVKTFEYGYKTLKGEDVKRNVHASIFSDPLFDSMVKDKLSIRTTEEALPDMKLLEKIPVFGMGFRMSDAMFTSFLHKLRADAYRELYMNAKKTGIKDPTGQGIGLFVNSLTGRGDLGWFEPAANVTNNLLFSPRLTKSRLDLVMTPFKFGSEKYSPFVRKQATIALVKNLALMSSAIAIAKTLMPDSVETDSRSSDWGKIRVGNTTFDVTGGFASLGVLLSRLATLESKSAETDKIKKINSGEYGSMTGLDVAVSFLGNKLSPLARTGYNYLQGEDYDGVPVTVGGEALRLVTPLPINNVIKSWQDPKAAPIIAIAILDGLGVSTNTYDPATRKKNRAKYKKLRNK